MPYLATTICVFLLVMTPVGIRRNWRGADSQQFMYSFSWLPVPDGVKRGMNRSMTVLFPAIVLLVVATLGVVIPAEFGIEVPRGVAVPLVLKAVGVEVVVVWFLVPSIVFFNRPKFLVPPAYRGQPGVFQEWLQRRRQQGV